MPQELVERLQSGHQGLGSEVSFGSKYSIAVFTQAPNEPYDLRPVQRAEAFPGSRCRPLD